MDEETRETGFDIARARVSRAQILKAMGVGFALAAIPEVAGADASSGSNAPGFSFPYYPQIPSGTYTPEAPRDILSNLLTLKTFDTSVAAFALTNASLLQRLNVAGPSLAVFQAVAAQEQYQIDWLQSLMPGVAPITTTFTVDPTLAASTQSFAAFALFTGYLYLGAELTAAREFAELGQPTLAKNMAQMAATHGEYVAAFRTLLLLAGVPGMTPPNNKAFETDIFLYTRDAIGLMKALGLIGGSGVSLTYPGRAAVLVAAGPMASAVIQKSPNNATTTEAFTGFAAFGGERT